VSLNTRYTYDGDGREVTATRFAGALSLATGQSS
jgi:YD repeat-containing protein